MDVFLDARPIYCVCFVCPCFAYSTRHLGAQNTTLNPRSSFTQNYVMIPQPYVLILLLLQYLIFNPPSEG